MSELKSLKESREKKENILSNSSLQNWKSH